ncbi:MAG: hypothetical protein ACYC1U_01830 [Candidatus Aquicultorales bacterium]
MKKLSVLTIIISLAFLGLYAHASETAVSAKATNRLVLILDPSGPRVKSNLAWDMRVEKTKAVTWITVVPDE